MLQLYVGNEHWWILSWGWMPTSQCLLSEEERVRTCHDHVIWSLNNARAFFVVICRVVSCRFARICVLFFLPLPLPLPLPLLLLLLLLFLRWRLLRISFFVSFMTASASWTSKGKRQQHPCPTFCITFKQTNKKSAANKQPVVWKECTCYCHNGAHRYTKVQHHPSPKLVRQPAEDYRANQPSSKDHGRSDTGQDRSVAD